MSICSTTKLAKTCASDRGLRSVPQSSGSCPSMTAPMAPPPASTSPRTRTALQTSVPILFPTGLVPNGSPFLHSVANRGLISSHRFPSLVLTLDSLRVSRHGRSVQVTKIRREGQETGREAGRKTRREYRSSVRSAVTDMGTEIQKMTLRQILRLRAEYPLISVITPLPHPTRDPGI